MIVSTDIASILARDVRELGVSTVYTSGNIPAGPLAAECVCIGVKPLKAETYWNIAEVELDLYVPDADAATERLAQLERTARTALGVPYAQYDATPYRYAIAETGVKADAEHQCHFIHIIIQFKVLNVKN